MAFGIIKVENKGADWKVVSLINAAGDLIENVSVNRISKKGDIFPGFDDIKEKTKIEGRLWESDSGKQYLFAPKGGAKATPKPVTTNTYNASEQEEYPIHEKVETILNKLVKQQITIESILEIVKGKANIKIVDNYEYPPNNEEEPPF